MKRRKRVCVSPETGAGSKARLNGIEGTFGFASSLRLTRNGLSSFSRAIAPLPIYPLLQCPQSRPRFAACRPRFASRRTMA